MNGFICKYIDNKNFGFISGADGKEYFFHKNNVINQNNLEVGREVDFNPSFNKKGFNAKDIKVGGELEKIYVNPPHFLVQSQSINLNRYKIFTLLNYSTRDRDPNIARQNLINKAASLGLNSVLDIQATRHTESSGNYNYTVHELNSALCLVKEIMFTSDKNKVINNAAEIKKEIEEIEFRISQENKNNIELNKRSGCFGTIFLLCLFVILVWSCLSLF